MKKINPLYSRAQATLEFALVLPLILLVILFTFDLGRVIFYQSLMNNAAREGARYASVYVYVAPILDSKIAAENDTHKIIEDYTKLLDADKRSIDVNINTYDRYNSFVKITIDYDVKPLTPILPIFMSGSEIHLDTASEMRLE